MTRITNAVNSSPLSAAYMRQWTRSSLVQVMACCLFGTKPLPETMLTYCQLDSWEHISVKFESEFYHFHSRKCSWKCRLPKWRPFCPGGRWVNSLYCELISDATWGQTSPPTVVQVMPCHIRGARTCCELEPWEFQWNFDQNTNISFHRNALKISSAKCQPFSSGSTLLCAWSVTSAGCPHLHPKRCSVFQHVQDTTN